MTDTQKDSTTNTPDAERSAERMDFLSLCLIGAVEGGIDYWSEIRNYRYQNAGDKFSDAYAEVREDGTNQWVAVTLDTVEKGIALLKTGDVMINSTILGWILSGDALNDTNDIDAEASDCIIQAALLGELRYG